MQDIPLQPLGSFLEPHFNALNTVGMAKWLSHSESEDYEARMKVLGNLVVPSCANLGCAILQQMAREWSNSQS